MRSLALDVPGWPGHLRRPARRPAAHGRGRIPGAAQLLDRLGAGGRRASRSRSSGSTTARCRRTWSTRCGRATGSSCAARSAATSCGSDGRRRRAGDADRGRLGDRAADGDAAPPRGGRRARAPVRLLASWRSRTRAIYAEELDRLEAAGDGLEVVTTLTRSPPPGWEGEVGRVTPEMLGPACVAGATAAARIRVRPDRVRRGGRGGARRARARARTRCAPSASGRREAPMDERDLRLDGNAAAGVLREAFGFEVTAARGRCEGCGAVEPIGCARSSTCTRPASSLRCVHCEAVMLRLVEAPDGISRRSAGYPLPRDHRVAGVEHAGAAAQSRPRRRAGAAV